MKLFPSSVILFSSWPAEASQEEADAAPDNGGGGQHGAQQGGASVQAVILEPGQVM